MFSYVSPEARVPADHPLRAIRKMVNRALEGLTREFEAMYSHTGAAFDRTGAVAAGLAASGALLDPKRTVVGRATGLQLAVPLVRGTVDGRAGVGPLDVHEEPGTVDGVGHRAGLLGRLLRQAHEGRLLSDEHFSVDGTLLEAWASLKSFRPKDGGGRPGGSGRNTEADFHGEKRSNATHQSSTDPQARLYRKGGGQEAKLCYLGHALMDNRHGLIADTRTTEGRRTG